MIRLASIVLSILILSHSIGFDVDELLKLDELMEHAQFHSSKYGDNFIVFLSKHYGELQDEHSQEHQDEKKEHEQLPFNNTSCSHVFTAFVLNKIYSPLSKSEQAVNTSSNFFYTEPFSLFEKATILQPPRQA
ncbi:hypothetical protein [Allomuricauda sp. SCSIO 65647]|uniref:hypothetical protein n=1 Tax=Allomuricauda sp. SCSIO 65647 TaxID=2908843 RepID=UPI001F264D7A|nr:hypothetical protein [Muricauda sp. SCSIO 65647]UJH68800.1 hypothetical protein L0P89_06175 [Muricauda sp. SCSIO 65647]